MPHVFWSISFVKSHFAYCLSRGVFSNFEKVVPLAHTNNRLKDQKVVKYSRDGKILEVSHGNSFSQYFGRYVNQLLKNNYQIMPEEYGIWRFPIKDGCNSSHSNKGVTCTASTLFVPEASMVSRNRYVFPYSITMTCIGEHHEDEALVRNFPKGQLTTRHWVIEDNGERVGFSCFFLLCGGVCVHFWDNLLASYACKIVVSI